jgi:hypothetical protein
MNRWLVRVGLLGAFLGLGYGGWIVLFPSPERIIAKRLAHIAHLASVAPNEGALARLANSQKLTTFCSSDVEIAVDVPGRVSQTLNGRDELLQAVIAAHSTLSPFKVEFLDVTVIVNPDKQSAQAHLTAKATFPGERTPEVQELKIDFRKVEHDWLIQHAETVRTLH